MEIDKETFERLNREHIDELDETMKIFGYVEKQEYNSRIHYTKEDGTMIRITLPLVGQDHVVEKYDVSLYDYFKPLPLRGVEVIALGAFICSYIACPLAW